MARKIVSSLDIGTTKTCAIIAEYDEKGLNILGTGIAKSEGMTKGTVANIFAIANSIRKAVNLAETQAKVKITPINVGVAGIYINSMRYRNFVMITNPDNIIQEHDVNKLLEDIKATRIPSDYFILHIIPETFTVDNENIVKNPVGVVGAKLEATHHLVLAHKTSTDNLKKAINQANLKINKLVLQPLASANAVLHHDEKEIGVALVDIGGGTTDLAVYVDNSIKHTRVIGVAGSHVTSDIRQIFNLMTETSEEIKIKHGCASKKLLIQDKEIVVNIGPYRKLSISTSILTDIIQLRMIELFKMIDTELKETNLKSKLGAGIVLTGGGSLLRGTTELAEEVFGLPVRLGIPMNLSGQAAKELENPIYSTAVGLLLNDIPVHPIQETVKNEFIDRTGKVEKLKNVFNKILEYFREF